VEGSQQAARAQGRPSDGATTERVAQAAQLFANLTQPGEPQRNGARPQPAGDPDGSEQLPDNQEVYELLEAALAANRRTEKTVELLRHDLDTTMSNVKLLHRAVTKALRFLNKRVGALERERPTGSSDPS
jgi:hypothetical protein